MFEKNALNNSAGIYTFLKSASLSLTRVVIFTYILFSVSLQVSHHTGLEQMGFKENIGGEEKDDILRQYANFFLNVFTGLPREEVFCFMYLYVSFYTDKLIVLPPLRHCSKKKLKYFFQSRSFLIFFCKSSFVFSSCKSNFGLTYFC